MPETKGEYFFVNDKGQIVFTNSQYLEALDPLTKAGARSLLQHGGAIIQEGES